MVDLKSRKFAVSSKTETDTGDLWRSTPIDYDTAVMILIHNGFRYEHIDELLEGCPDEYIIVNDNTQIC